jgi:thioester reductase-like protein
MSISYSSISALSSTEKRALLSQLLTKNDDSLQSFSPHIEGTLDSTIYPSETVPNQSFKVKSDNILLTGSTGFLGAFLLSELLQHTKANIYCIVRSTSVADAISRIKENLERYCLWEDSFALRIVPLPGDLSKPLLGISIDEFQFLSQKIDIIYHNAALLNFVYSYFALKAVNVLGTQEILRLACQNKIKPVHYVSSFAVFESGSYSTKVVTETDEPDGAGIHLGYSQSKWASEKLVLIARSRGLPVCIYRAPLISGDSKTGFWNTDDFVCRTIKSFIQTSNVPKLDYILDISPVDYVSKAIVQLSIRHDVFGRNFHLNNPNPIHLSALVDYIRSLGISLEQISYDEWRIKISKLVASENNSAFLLLPFFVKQWSKSKLTIPEMYQQERRPQIICTDTTKMLSEAHILCPPVDKVLLDTYFSYFVISNFLNPYDK